mgnify:CR=1 FL=1
MLEFYTYGCPCLTDSFPPTYYRLDRKSWARAEAKAAQHETMLVIGGTDSLWNAYSGAASVEELEASVYLVQLKGESVEAMLIEVDPTAPRE